MRGFSPTIQIYIFIFIQTYLYSFEIQYFVFHDNRQVKRIYEQVWHLLSRVPKPYVKRHILYKSMRMGNTVACCTIEIVK